MNQEQIQRVRASFDVLTHRVPELADRFHTRLLAQQPMLRAMFPRDLGPHKQDFAAGLRLVVKNLDRMELLTTTLMDIGARQARLGITPQHYGVAREVLISTLREMSGPAWDDLLTRDWTEALSAVVSMMVVGGSRTRQVA
ncbi:MAG: globin domain-containing protein [Phycisphaerales bacterium]